MDRIRVNRKAWQVIVLSILIPGLGHFFVRRWDKGLFIINSFITHLVIANFMLHMVVIEQPLTILYLMYVIPYHYFYAIYDSLVCSELQERYKVRILLLGSVILLCTTVIFINKWQFIYPFKAAIVKLYPLLLLLFLVTYLLLSIKRKMQQGRYYARISSIILLSLLAITITVEQFAAIDWKYWLYVIPFVISIEVLIIYLLRKYQSKLKVDYWGMIVSVVLIATSYAVVQYSDYPTKLLESFHAPTIEQQIVDGEVGITYELPEIIIPIAKIDKLNLHHANGAVHIKKGDVKELTISPVLFVDTEDKELADQVRMSSYVDVTFQNGLTINTDLPRHSLNHYPRMNLNIVIPKDYVFIKEANLRVDFGLLSVSDLVATTKIILESNEAAIHTKNIIGPLSIQSKRGNIFVNRARGDIDIETKKGDITIVNGSRSVKAVSLNGNIYVGMNHVNGNVNLTATVGSIVLESPVNLEQYRLEAKVSFGKITDIHQEAVRTRRAKELIIPNKDANYEISMYASDYILLK